MQLKMDYKTILTVQEFLTLIGLTLAKEGISEVRNASLYLCPKLDKTYTAVRSKGRIRVIDKDAIFATEDEAPPFTEEGQP